MLSAVASKMRRIYNMTRHFIHSTSLTFHPTFSIRTSPSLSLPLTLTIFLSPCLSVFLCLRLSLQFPTENSLLLYLFRIICCFVLSILVALFSVFVSLHIERPHGSSQMNATKKGIFPLLRTFIIFGRLTKLS